MKKTLKFFMDLFVLFLSLSALLILVIAITSKRDSDGTANLFGYQLRFIVSSSMESSDSTDVSSYQIKNIPIKSMILVQNIPETDEQSNNFYNNVKTGDVLTFKYVYSSQETITHRVISKEPNHVGGWFIKLKGDNQTTDTTGEQIINTSDTDSNNYIIGQVIYTNLFLGTIINAVKEPLGIILLIIIPSLVIIVIQIIKIISIIHSKRNENNLQQNVKQIKEIELLKQELELMKQSIEKLE